VNWCYKARECPYFVVRIHREQKNPKKALGLTCTGQWGLNCLIWKELEIGIPSYRIKPYKMK
jgi:hypothetical protein